MDASRRTQSHPDIDALAGLDARHGGQWFIWADRAGCHARRKGASLAPDEAGWPLQVIHAGTIAGLAAQLTQHSQASTGAGARPQARPPGAPTRASGNRSDAS